MGAREQAQTVTIQSVFRMCGWDVVKRLIRAAAGQSFAIPREPTEELRRQLGAIGAMRLAHRLGGNTVFVPEDDSEILRWRDHEVRWAHHNYRLSVPDLCAEFGLGEHQVREALANARPVP